MSNRSVLEFSPSLEMSDSVFNAPSREELSRLLRILPDLPPNEMQTFHSEGGIGNLYSLPDVAVFAPRSSVGDQGALRRHHFDPDEEVYQEEMRETYQDDMQETYRRNLSSCNLEVVISKSSNSAPLPSKALKKVGTFAA